MPTSSSSRLFFASGLLLATALLGCSSSPDDESATDHTEGRVTNVGVGIDAACVDYATDSTATDDTPFADGIAVTDVERCIFSRSASELSVSLRENGGNGDGAIALTVVGFTGPGSYTTGAPLDSTLVEMHGSAGEYDSAGDSPGDDSPAETCTLQIDTNLHSVEMPNGQSTTGWLELSASCPKLGAAGIGIIECELDPADWSIVIAECEAVL